MPRLVMSPVVLRHGTPLFKASGLRQDLTLLEARSLDTGAVILRYGPKR